MVEYKEAIVTQSHPTLEGIERQSFFPQNLPRQEFPEPAANLIKVNANEPEPDIRESTNMLLEKLAERARQQKAKQEKERTLVIRSSIKELNLAR